MTDVYDGTTTTPVSAEAWLAEMFRDEYCAECRGDAEHHTAIDFLGNPFARCDYPPDTDGNPHPVIVAFRGSMED